MNKKKLLSIITLPIMWLIYFLFELFTGRINDFNTIIGNILLMLLFALIGYIFYVFTAKKIDGLTKKEIFIYFFILMIIDHGIKIVIKLFFFNYYFSIFNGFLSFNPIINTDGSWLNARFGTSVSFPILIMLNIIALIIFVELYRYYRSKGNKNIFSDLTMIFIVAGALCSLVDKIFYGGSLDFIGISNLFIADFKDMYINIGILFLIILLYNNGFFSNGEDTTLKEDFKSIKKFIIFIGKDIKSMVLKNK